MKDPNWHRITAPIRVGLFTGLTAGCIISTIRVWPTKQHCNAAAKPERNFRQAIKEWFTKQAVVQPSD